MGRKYFDCRGYPAGPKCTMILSAETEDELVEAVVQHIIKVHGDTDNSELRKLVRDDIKEGASPV
jgi:predicted small metal-binding protein